MAYINISNDGNRLVGPLGLKKAEQELIKRRYKYQHYSNNQDTISRVALVYGQNGTNSGGSLPRQGTQDSQGISQGNAGGYGYSGNYNGGGITPSYYYAHNNSQNNNPPQQPSPYLQYTRDIQNLYRRQKQLQGHGQNQESRVNLPRINNSRDITGTS